MLVELGRGGMGVVYRARHRLTEELVALKSITGAHATDPEYARRFAREVKVLHRLHHPGVVRLLHSGIHQGSPWLALELVEGRTLREAMRGGPLPLREVLRLGARIAEALEYTHSMDVVHRDLKPENVLTTASGQVKVTDFGLAGLRTGHGQVSRLTRDGATLGTYDYMAPEQRGDAAEAGPAADLYALGVMLFEMLTGRLPHGAEAPGPSVPGLPAELDRLVGRMLEREPGRRPAGAGEVRRQLEALREPAEPQTQPLAEPAERQSPVVPTVPAPPVPPEPPLPVPGPGEARTSLLQAALFGWWRRSPALTAMAICILLLGFGIQWQQTRKPPSVPDERSVAPPASAPAAATAFTAPASPAARHTAATERPGPPRWPGPPPGVQQLPSPSQSLPDPTQAPPTGDFAVRKKPRLDRAKDEEITLGDPSIQMTVQTYLAEQALEKGKLDEAIGHYVFLRNRQPSVPRVHKRLAELYLKANRPDAAAAEYQSVLQLAPDDREARGFLAARRRAAERR